MATRPNLQLPELSVFDPRTRSSWAMALFVAAGVLALLGIDLMAVLREMGVGSTPEEVIATGERAVSAVNVLVMLGAGIWTWIERRAPNFRLVLWPRRRSPPTGVDPATRS